MQREPDFIFERQTGGSFLPRSRSAPTPTRKASANQPLELLALEDRVLYSAVPIDLPDAAPNEPSNLENLEQQVNDLIHWTSLLAAADLVEPGATSETIGQSAPEAGGAILVVVDQGIADYQTLLDDIRNQLPEQHSLLLIDSTGDGWLQLNQYLSQHQGIQQVHLFSHAASGQLLLGNQSLQLDDLFNDDSAAIWQRALDPDADVFLYGCQLAADSAGEQFVSQFAMFSGADVAASIDQTGNASGADWDLELSVGLLNSDSLFSDDHSLHWEGTLDPQTFTRAGVQELSGIDRGSTSAVSVNSNGSYIIVWSEQVSGNGWDVLACRFNADGTQNGSVFTVNQDTGGDQRYASVDMDSTGRFIITWTGIDNGNNGILARLYAANGTALTNEFVVNTYRPSAQYNSSVSMAQDGRFVIAWEGNGAEDNQGIYAQRYDTNANAVGSQIFVNSTEAGAQENPTVSMNSLGAFVVAWNDETSFRYQRFDSNGNKLDQNGLAAAEMTVSAIGTARHGDILLNHDGTVVSTWQEYASGFWDVYFQKDAVNGSTLISKSLVLTNDTTDQLAPSIDGSGNGEFIITWEGRETGDLNGGVFYRLYNSTGLATPYTFLANGNYTASHQGLASVAATSLENYVVVWSGNSASDTSDIGHNNVRNAIPVGVNDSTSLAEAGGYGNSGIGSLLPVNVLNNDTDTGDTLLVVGVVQGAGGISTSNVGSPLAGTYGTLTLAADGNVAYSLDQLNASVQALRTSANTLTETFTYTVRDSGNMVSTATLTITITGQNDAPTAVSDTATAVEASGVSNGTAGTNPTGNVLTNDPDPDSGDTKTVTGVAAGSIPLATGNVGTAVTGTYGSINISSTGNYTYTVDNNNSTVQALRTSSDTLTEIFTYTMIDAAGLTSTSQITVTIQGANDTPTVNTLSSPNIAENSANGTVVTTASATEVDSGDTVTFSLSNNAGGRFTINSSTGVITVANSALLNFEAATSHLITIRVTDGNATNDRNLTINLTDVNEFPLSAISDSNAATNSVNENATNGSAVGVTALATDGDGSAIVTYSLLDNAGGRFAINSATGVVTKIGSLDFETTTSHTITVQASSNDGGTSTANFVITVTDFNEFVPTVPVDNNPAVNEVVENSAAGTLVGITASSVDNDGSNNTVTYSLTNSAGGRFAIDSNTGVVTLTSLSVNYEQATSHNITVQALSSDGSFSSQTFTINVLNGGNEISGLSDLNVLPDTLAENALLGSSVITAFSSHPDALVITYSLTNDGGGRFGIDSSTGVVTLISALNYEAATSHLITVRADATDGSFATHSFTIAVQDIDEFDVGLVTDNNGATNTIAENSANGATVGLTARATDADGTNNTITYSLDNNAGGRFAINSSTGVVTVANGTLLDFESATSHSVTVRATSDDTSFSTANFTINLTNVNEAPTITNGATHTLTPTTEDATSSGTLASAILTGVNWADVDASAVSGLAITGTTGSGNWQFSTDGVSWTNFGAVSGTNALLITSTTQVRYTPNTQNAELATFNFKAWDRTTGTASTNGTPRYASTATSGGSTPYSAGNATASMSVTAVNDAPTITNNAAHTLTPTNEDTTSSGTLASAILTGVNWTDVDSSAANGLAITGTTGSGAWEYSTDGTTWANFGAVSSTNALLITSSTRVRYTPNTQNAETATFTFKAWDQTSGTASTNSLARYVSVASSGTTTAFSANNATSSISVTAVNDAPTITDSATHTLTSTTEDAISSGTLASAILSGVSWSDVDTGALSGLAITGVTGSGNWRYSTDGTTWANFGAVSNTNALLITSNTQVRYSPNTQNAETATFTFKAWDQTSGTASTNATASYASTATSGGTAAFSTSNATASMSVTALNDAPTVSSGANYSFSSVNEDTTSAGVLASTILTNASWADVDTGAVNGMAITGATGAGTWQYSTDGSNWSNFGAVSGTNSLLITSTTQIRYIPDGQNGETATFTYKAWDRTSGTASTNATPSYASTITPGGTSAFSINNATGQIVVTSVNDAPTISSGDQFTLASVNEDTTSAGAFASTILSGASWADVDASALSGMAITGVTGNGTWQYSTDGTTWANFGAVSGTNALLITSTSQIRYVPNGQNDETATFTYKAWDQTSGTASTNATPRYASTAIAGGTTAFSTNNATGQIVVSSVNDAPTITSGAIVNFSSVNEDTTSVELPISAFLSGPSWADVDTGAVGGMAITSATGNGNWQYSTDGITWANFGSVSGTNSLLINSTSQIRYVPNGQNGETATFTYKAWDETSGIASTNSTPSYASTASAGGTTAFSTNDATGQIIVTSVNDAPTITNNANYALNSTTEDATSSGTLASAILSGVTWADVDTGALGGLAITGTTGSGNWQYSTDGSTWNSFGAVSSTNALLITSATQVRYTPGSQNEETATFSFKAWDQISGTASTNASPSYASTATAGGTTAFSTSNATASISVTGVNDSPTAANDNATAVEAGGINNNTAGTNPTGNVLANDTDPDAGDTKTITGVAAGIISNASGNVAAAVTGTYGSINIAADGTFHYTVDNNNPAVQALRTSANTLTDTFTYTMRDAAGLTSTTQISVTIQGANDAPVDLATTGLTITENATNGTAAGTVTPSDLDTSDGATYSLLDSAGGRFAINSSTGEVTVDNGTLINRETAATHNITVRVTDTAGAFYDEVFTVNVTDADEFDVSLVSDSNAAANDVFENAANGTQTGVTASASDADATNNSITYSLDNSAGGRFAIDSSTGVVTVANGTLLDREAAASHSIVIRATSSDGSFSTQSFTINLNDVDEFDVGAITDANATPNSIAENSANGTTVSLTASATDADATYNTITFSLDESAGGRFAIDSSTGMVTVADSSLLNYEAATSHSITIRATSSDGSTSVQTFIVNLNDVDEFDVGPVSDSNSAANTIAEDSAVGTLAGITATATDADATTNVVNYSLDDSAGGRFAIDSSTGVVTIANSGLLNFEAAASHSIIIRATSADGSSSIQSFTINLTNVNENPTAVNDSAVAVEAGGIANATPGSNPSGNVLANDSDPDSGDTKSIVGVAAGTPASALGQVGTSVAGQYGTLVLQANGSYNFIVDNSNWAVQTLRTSSDTLTDTFTYTMTDAGGQQSTARLSIQIVGANDNPAEQWSEVGLAINQGSSNNQYVLLQNFNQLIGAQLEFTIRVSISTTQSQFFLFSYATNSDDNEFRIYAYDGTLRLSYDDIDWHTGVSSSLVSDGQRHELTVVRDSWTGGLKLFIDGDLAAQISGFQTLTTLGSGGTAVLAQDQDSNGGSFNTSQFFRGTIWDLSFYDTAWSNSRVANEVGTASNAADLLGHWSFNSATGGQITDDVGGRNGTLNSIFGSGWTPGTPASVQTDWLNPINENPTANLSVGFLTAYDIDTGDSLTWHLSNDADGRFAINASTGEITVANSSLIDRETAASYQITAVVTDLAGGTLARTYTITVNDVDEFDVSTIVDGNAAANQVAENSAIGTLVGLTAQAFDGDATNNTINYTLTNSAGGRFAIDSTTGAVRVANGALLNRESAVSHTITVRATSADGSSSLQSFTIDVTDADEFDVGPLSDINTASNSVNENAASGTFVGITASASDADSTNNSITYSLDNSAGGRFNIDASTGVVSVADSSLLDREAASSHAITIRATSEDGSFSTESYVINLNDVDEFDVSVPVDSNASTNAVSEGAANGLLVGITATASDTDATTNTIIWSLDDSAGGRFAINANTGVVTVANGSLLDRETDNSHSITVRAASSDGSFSISTFQIQIENVNESPVANADQPIAIEAGGLNNNINGVNPIGNVLANDSDTDLNDTRVVIGVQAGAHASTNGAIGQAVSGLYGTLILNGDGSYTYTVNNTHPDVEALRNSGNQLTDTFSYTIQDAGGLQSTAQISVIVQGANDTPDSMWSETGLLLNSGLSNNQYLEIENLGNLLSGDEFTLRLSFTSNYTNAFFLSYAANSEDNEFVIRNQANKLTIYLKGQAWNTAIDSSLLTDGERHEIGLVRTASDGGLKVFIDGVLKDSRTGLKSGMLLANAGTLVLGQEQDAVGGSFSANQIFRGTYWDLSVHSTAWSSGRVQLNTGHTFHDLPDLRGHWDFELSGGDTVFDQIGTRHGSLRSIPAGGNWIAGTPEQIRADWKPNLLENAANGTVVANPRASDIDQGERLTWSLTDSAGGRFAIDSSTGQITVADSSQLNFEHLRSHQIQVRVTDEGGLFREETYQIHLTDVQETDVSIPVDDNLAPNQVLENSNTGSLVGLTAWAIDQDGTTNQVTYSLDDDAGGRFTINSSTGVVTVANGNLLDREDAASHEIVVRATSEDGTTATQRFTIAVGDVSEFAIGPISDRNPSDNLLRESATTGTAVGITAQASDPDATNNTVRYSLDDNAGGRFVIDENTGVVSVAGDGLLDYEAVSTVSIIVRASSSDGSFVTQTFVINLVDVDEFDTGPISDVDTTDNMVYENSEIGTYIGLTAFAQDADATNSGIVYRLADDDGGRFSIDSTTGRVFTNAMLDFETDGQYRTIQVAAVSEDGSNMTRSFQIEIADIFKESFATYAGMNVEFSPTEILTSSRDENYQITNLTLENAPAFGDLMIVGSTGARMVSARELSSLSISPNERLRFISPSTTQGNVTLGYTAMNSEGRERTGTVTIMVEAAAPPAPPPPTISFTNNDSGSSSSSERAPSGDSPSERSVAVEQDATASSSSGGEASGSAAGGAVMAVGPISGSGGTAGAGFEFAEDGEASERTADTGSGKSSGDANQQGEKTAGESGLFTSIANLMQTSGADSFVSAADSGVVTRVFATAAAIEQKLTNSTQFTEYLSKLETALQQTPVVVGFEMPAYASAGASLFTVGYVAWLIRGGVLLTSFMSSLPSWQSFDPLPILENAGSGDGDSGADGSDSSIAELVDSEQPVPLMSGTAG
jgi:VCBS repeat-containing protein